MFDAHAGIGGAELPMDVLLGRVAGLRPRGDLRMAAACVGMRGDKAWRVRTLSLPSRRPLAPTAALGDPVQPLPFGGDAEALCEALAEVHDGNWLHRDIKPSNVVLAADQRIVLIDFGSAREFHLHRTQQHTRILTAQYAAPEQYSEAARFGPYGRVQFGSHPFVCREHSTVFTRFLTGE